jgi:proteasome lid subunit RPN8/RPN11
MEKSTSPKFEITQDLINLLIYQSLLSYPKEHCGFLGGTADRIGGFVQVPNVSMSPDKCFNMTPEGAVFAFDMMDKIGQVIHGIYHSHPDGQSCLSEIDRQVLLDFEKVKTQFGLKSWVSMVGSIVPGQAPTLEAFWVLDGEIVPADLVLA